MSTPKASFHTRTVDFVNSIYERAMAECARRTLARGGACYISELVNESLDATLPRAEGESPVIPIKKVKRKTRPSARWKQPA